MRISIDLTIDEFEALRKLAAAERRNPREQAALMVSQSLGFGAEIPSDGEPEEEPDASEDDAT